MFRWMPVSGKDHATKKVLALLERVSVFEDLVALRYRKRSPFAEIILHIDDNQNSRHYFITYDFALIFYLYIFSYKIWRINNLLPLNILNFTKE